MALLPPKVPLSGGPAGGKDWFDKIYNVGQIPGQARNDDTFKALKVRFSHNKYYQCKNTNAPLLYLQCRHVVPRNDD